MSVWHQGVSFLRHLAVAGDAHAVHSPFVFDLYRRAEAAAKPWLRQAWHPDAALAFEVAAEWKAIEAERKRLRASREVIEIQDLGAGSQVDGARRRAVGGIARSGLLPASWCRRLAALRAALPPGPVLELGTSLGITTAYLASVQPASKVYTLEGCAATLAQAEAVWGRLGLQGHIYPTLGNIDDTLASVLPQGPFAMVVLDANHRAEAVLRYFEAILPHLHPQGCVVVDDIYWTPDMTAGWRALQRHAQVRQWVDLYRQGWLFARANQAAEGFVLRALG